MVLPIIQAWDFLKIIAQRLALKGRGQGAKEKTLGQPGNRLLTFHFLKSPLANASSTEVETPVVWCGAHDRSKYGYHQSPTWSTMSFIGVTNRNMGEELLTGVEMTQTATAPKPAPGQVTGTELDTWSSLHSCRQRSCLDSDPQLPPCMLAWEGDLVNLVFWDPLKPLSCSLLAGLSA